MLTVKPRPKLDARLPATPCDSGMEKQMRAIALSEGVTLAELQRQAIALFLSLVATKSNDDTKDGIFEYHRPDDTPPLLDFGIPRPDETALLESEAGQ